MYWFIEKFGPVPCATLQLFVVLSLGELHVPFTTYTLSWKLTYSHPKDPLLSLLFGGIWIRSRFEGIFFFPALVKGPGSQEKAGPIWSNKLVPPFVGESL